jgi:hypothetical protein
MARSYGTLIACSLAFLPSLAAWDLAPITVTPLAAQTRPAGAAWQVPRTADGHADLQGNWTNVTLTPFQRPEGRGPTYTAEEARQIELPDDECPPNPGTVACGRSQASGSSNEARLSGNEYNEVYWDRGSKLAVVNGEYRSSLITRPEDGRRPALTPFAEQAQAERTAFRTRFEQYDHPEIRPLGERCIVSFGSSAGPPMIPNSAYNNNYTIVQTADHVMIVAEMVHDVRVIRLGDPATDASAQARLPAQVKPYFGDSWGRWEGDVLVVETTNLNPDHAFQGVVPTERTKVIERFTRVDDDTILYEFTIDDPDNYTEPWGGQIPMERFDDLLYEYSCHEGNYALGAVLSGARYEESQAQGVAR